MFRYIGFFSREFDIGGGRRRELWFVFFSYLLNILFLVSFYSNYGFLSYYGPWEAKNPTWGLKHENLRVRKPIATMAKSL